MYTSVKFPARLKLTLYAYAMLSGSFALHRIAAIVLLAFTSLYAHAAQPNTQGTSASPLISEGFDNGTVALNGPCQFHAGDDLTWASPAYDSSAWGQLSAD